MRAILRHVVSEGILSRRTYRMYFLGEDVDDEESTYFFEMYACDFEKFFSKQVLEPGDHKIVSIGVWEPKTDSEVTEVK